MMMIMKGLYDANDIEDDVHGDNIIMWQCWRCYGDAVFDNVNMVRRRMMMMNDDDDRRVNVAHSKSTMCGIANLMSVQVVFYTNNHAAAAKGHTHRDIYLIRLSSIYLYGHTSSPNNSLQAQTRSLTL